MKVVKVALNIQPGGSNYGWASSDEVYEALANNAMPTQGIQRLGVDSCATKTPKKTAATKVLFT